MVTPDTRNNIMTLAAIVAIAILITAFIYIFSSSLIQVAQHGEQTLNIIGKSVAGNVSKAADVNQLNLKQFNQSMADVIQSNDRIVSSNKQSITNLSTIVQNFSKINTKYLGEVDNNITSNNKLLQQLYSTHTAILGTLQNISKQMSMLVGNVSVTVPSDINETTGKPIIPSSSIINHK